jgi:hypothetical protein
VEEVTELSEIEKIVSQLDKPYLTPMSSPAHNDFTQRGVIYLVARKGGEPVMMGCARLEDLGPEPVGKYWERVFSRAYGSPTARQVIQRTPAMIDQTLTGKLVYFGDLFVAKKTRGGRSALRAFVAIGHLAVSLKWDPDWTYCFIRERDILAGAGALYGFNRDLGPAFHWTGEPPHPRDRSEQLVALSRSDLPMVTMRTVAAVTKQNCNSDHQKREIQNGSLTSGITHTQ